ncbi:MAG: mechanosensitive ion channel family protein [Gemmatimonadota bacterium]|nr:mechanosensitive ion channel family protein [Gemmatimonadota bacterium]
MLASSFLWTASVAAQDSRATVRLDGRSVFRVGMADTLSARDRALRIERRLSTLLETPRALGPARIEPSGEDRVVTIAGVPVTTVSRADADDNLTTVDALASQWARALDAELTRAATRRLSTGGRFSAEVRGSVQAAFARLGESAVTIVPRLLAALLVIGLFWLLATGARWLMRLVFRRVVDDRTIENLIRQVAYYAIWAVGLMLAIDALGFQPQTVVTGLGLTGLALGFALKDIISNFVSGVLILALRPFELGDEIVVSQTEGSVERIELRATHIRTYGGRLVLIPNAEVFTSRVTNNTASPVRRASVTLYLGYETDLRRASDVALRAAQETSGVLDHPSAVVRIEELGPDDIIVEVRFWADSRRSDFVATQSAVRAALVAALREAGIALPDPDVRHLVAKGSDTWLRATGVAPPGASRSDSP